MMEMFGNRLRMAIKESGKSQVDFASISGFSAQNINHFITGRREPTLGSLAKLLEAMPEVNARWLITGSRAL